MWEVGNQMRYQSQFREREEAESGERGRRGGREERDKEGREGRKKKAGLWQVVADLWGRVVV